MRVLAAVAAMPGPSNLSSIAQAVSLSPSQTHRYLASLMAAGMLKQDGRYGLYDLDAGAIRIGLAALSRIDVFSSADEHVRDLVLGTRRTCFVSVWGDAGPTIVRWFPGSPPVMTALSIGSNLPLLRSATGQIFFAFGDRDEMDRQGKLLQLHDPAGSAGNLPHVRRRVREAEFATNGGSLIPGLRAVAAPVFDLQRNLILVISLLAGSAFPESEDDAATQALIATCRALSGSLGAPAVEEGTASAGEALATSA